VSKQIALKQIAWLAACSVPLGTAAYMSPEQAKGKSNAASKIGRTADWPKATGYRP
jgi:serine/threonine protein kinase